MARFTTHRWHRLALGVAIFVAGAVLLIARPSIALAHHVTVTETASCTGWSTIAEYIGGPDDRKIVVDVTVNGEHITRTFYFDNAAGHLGHQDYYLLYQRTGAGSLQTSGTITMYQKVNGAYTSVVNVASPDTNLNCGPTTTPTSTATATRTATPVPSSTPTATAVAPSNTPTSTATVQEQGTATPLATNTPPPTATVGTGDTITPLATNTATSVATTTSTTVAESSTSTPASNSTPVATGNIETPAAQSTPTLVSIVHGSTFPERPGEDQSPASPSERQLPSTGQGARTPGAILAGLLGTVLAAIGLGVCATGLRARRTE